MWTLLTLHCSGVIQLLTSSQSRGSTRSIDLITWIDKAHIRGGEGGGMRVWKQCILGWNKMRADGPRVKNAHEQGGGSALANRISGSDLEGGARAHALHP